MVLNTNQSTNQFVCEWIDSLADRYVAPGKQYDE